VSHEFEFYHGIALCKIIHNSPNTTIKLYSEKSNSSYIVNGSIGIFVKYSTKRMSPWQFTFAKSHCDDLFTMMKNFKRVFLILVCRDDGIVCLNSQEIEKLIVKNHHRSQGLSVSRRPREKYRVASRRGLKYKIADNKFPMKLFE
jgi:hypothetical protein